MGKSLFVVGMGGHAKSLASLASDLGFEVAAYISKQSKLKVFENAPVFSDYSCLRESSDVNIAIALGDNYLRERTYLDLKEYVRETDVKIRFPKLIHPSVSLGKMAEVEEGSIVFPGANIGAHSFVSSFCILNHLSSIDHESVMKQFSSCAPGVVTGGNVEIGERSAILIGAAVAHRVVVGADTVLAGNSFLNSDAQDLKLYGGSPARVLKDRYLGEPYL